MRKIIFTNFLGIFLWLLAYFLSLFHFRYFLNFVGFLIFFLPGLNFAFFVEQLVKKTQGRGKILLWTVIFSFILTPAIIYVASSWFSRLADERITLITFFSWLLFSLICFVIAKFFRKTEISNLKIDFKQNQVLWLALAIFILLFIILFVIYPFIPEADPYVYLGRLKSLFDYHGFIYSEPRIFYVSLLWSFIFLSKIPDYILFKFIFPLISGAILIFTFYVFAKDKINSNFYKFIASVSILFIPVVVQETLITRPQQIFLVCLPVVLYLLTDILKNKKNLYFFESFLFLFLATIIGFLIHELFVVLIFICFIGMILFLKNHIRKYPWESFLVFVFFGVFCFSLIQSLSLQERLGNLILPFVKVVLHPKFRFWFLGNYTSIDGTEMEWAQGGVNMDWSKLGQLSYYGYNLGFFLPFIFILSFFEKIKIKKIFSQNFFYVLSFFIFFAIAEIFPRFGLFFLPERAWLFTSLSLLFLLIVLLSSLEKKLLKIKWQSFFIAILIVSLVLSSYIVYLKQGWVTRNEYRVAQFIKNNLPQDAVFVTQQSNGPFISYYAQRNIFKSPQSFFYGDLSNEDIEMIKNLPEIISSERKLKNKVIATQKEFNETMRKIFETNNYFCDNSINSYLESQIEVILDNKKKLCNALIRGLNKKRPIYVLYSFDKFITLYKSRTWWLKANFYGANLDKFDKNPQFFRLIYDQNNVKIWQVKL